MLTHNYKNIQKQHTFAACGNITKNKSVFRLPFFGIYCGFFICLFQYEIMLMPWAAWVFFTIWYTNKTNDRTQPPPKSKRNITNTLTKLTNKTKYRHNTFDTTAWRGRRACMCAQHLMSYLLMLLTLSTLMQMDRYKRFSCLV